MAEKKSSALGLPEQALEDVPEVERLELAKEQGRANLPPPIPMLDREARDAFGVDLYGGQRLVQVVVECLASILATGRSVEVVAFGRFNVRPYRPARPARWGDFSFVEAPYYGPLDFIPSSVLQRQVNSLELDVAANYRCDALYNLLRDDQRVPRGKASLLVKSAFRALVAVLLARNLVELPGVGLLVLRPRPNELKVLPPDNTLRVTRGLKMVLLRPSPLLIEQIPGKVVPREAPPVTPPPLVMVPVEVEDLEE